MLMRSHGSRPTGNSVKHQTKEKGNALRTIQREQSQLVNSRTHRAIIQAVCVVVLTSRVIYKLNNANIST
jgi:hypothetical protein